MCQFWVNYKTFKGVLLHLLGVEYACLPVWSYCPENPLNKIAIYQGGILNYQYSKCYLSELSWPRLFLRNAFGLWSFPQNGARWQYANIWWLILYNWVGDSFEPPFQHAQSLMSKTQSFFWVFLQAKSLHFPFLCAHSPHNCETNVKLNWTCLMLREFTWWFACFDSQLHQF